MARKKYYNLSIQLELGTIVNREPVRGIDELRQVWWQAMEDKTPGVPVSEVLNRLERKYQKLADAGK